jgi:hypothetical protein
MQKGLLLTSNVIIIYRFCQHILDSRCSSFFSFHNQFLHEIPIVRVIAL